MSASGLKLNRLEHLIDERVSTTLVINELDPISNGGANFAEFIEILNVGVTPINLKDYKLRLTTMLADPAPADYRTPVELYDYVLNPGDLFVVCATPANVPHCKVTRITREISM